MCEINDIPRHSLFCALLILICFALLPFLGISDFNTKGEPREAVVALSMLDQDNWILPVNNGGDIPYKPPFFHWCITAASLLNGGILNEYTSRLPSALALIAMTMTVFSFFARRRSQAIGLITALVTFTAFEIWRAGMNCRVDMMLTALTVCAILALFRWWEQGMRPFPWDAILLMSAATLTKGPVGIIIPCLSVGIFMLLRGVPFFKAFIRLCLWGMLSLILPLCWYAAAYSQGGETFLSLVLEENFGRMTGTMAYESHLNPWYYNILTLLSGFLPWTLAGIAALFVTRWKGLRSGCSLSRFSHWIRTTSPVTLLALVTSLTIFIFYCIPASKRSVYLMPMYPFTALFIAEMLVWMASRRPGSLRWLGDTLAALGVVLFAAFIAIKCGFVPESIFGHGKHAPQNAAMLASLRHTDGFRPWFWASVAPAFAIVWWAKLRNASVRAEIPVSIALVVISLYMSLSGCYQPAVLNTKSVKKMAREITRLIPVAELQTYEYIEDAEKAKGNPEHFFELNFYMGDIIRSFTKDKPTSGYLLIREEDMKKVLPDFKKAGYTFTPVYTPAPSMPRHTPTLYCFPQIEPKSEVKDENRTWDPLDDFFMDPPPPEHR